MKERALNSIISIYALVAIFKPGKGYTLITNILEVYLSSNFSRQTTDLSLARFRQNIKQYVSLFKKNPEDFHDFFKNEIHAHCSIISREISLQQRMNAMIFLIEYIPYMSGKSSFNTANESYNLIFTIAEQLDIHPQDFNDAVNFCTETFQKISPDNPLFIITDNPAIQIPGITANVIEDLNGQLIFLRLKSLDLVLFKVSGKANFEINDRKLYQKRTYILNKGTVIHADSNIDFYYNDISKALLETDFREKLTLEAKNIEYRFRKGNFGLHNLSINCQSGEILAIMGGSGSGKTTLMNLLIGARRPSNGVVTLNGINVFSNPDQVKGHIGYVPQDDALNEELTAFENLYFISELSSGILTKDEKIAKVNKLLKELDLSEIKDLRVGNPLEKIISGGQRKRLNIAIELIRDPGILFLDEPTSGLSSADSENIMQILRDAAGKGQMVILNIHQPSSDIFKMFDKLLFIDQGGYPVFFGHAMQISSYLKSSLKLVDAHENECQTCGNLNPDDIFRYVQIETIASREKSDERRIFPPQRWHRRFIRNLPKFQSALKTDTPTLHPIKIETPNRFKQFRIYSFRNLLTKLADYPALILSLVLPPLLGLLLSVFSRYIAPLSTSYNYHENENIPPFLFMSVIVAMFIGIMSSSTEIIRDRKILKRESFLNLCFTSYLFAKIFYLSVLSALQMGTYVLITQWVLQIPSGNIAFFNILWTTAIASNIIGLLLSSVFKTMASVYITIPFILIPQILFSGAVIDFNKINPFFKSDKYVPLISEGMTSRWALEALSVSFFMKNDYASEFYDLDHKLNKTAYYRNFMIPELEKQFYGDSWSSSQIMTEDSVNYHLVKSGIDKIRNFTHQENFITDTIYGITFNRFISESREILTSINDSVQVLKDTKITKLGSEEYNRLQRTRNRKISQVVTDENNIEKITTSRQEFIRKMAPVYFISSHTLGRSHLYAPGKRIGNHIVRTPIFNNLVISIMGLILLVIIIVNRPKY